MMNLVARLRTSARLARSSGGLRAGGSLEGFSPIFLALFSSYHVNWLRLGDFAEGCKTLRSLTVIVTVFSDGRIKEAAKLASESA